MLRTIINRYTCSFALIFAGAFAWASLAQAQVPAPPKGALSAPQSGTTPIPVPLEAPGEVIVRLAAGAPAQQIASAYGLEVKSQLHYAPNTYVLTGVQGSTATMVNKLRHTPGVLGANVNAVYKPMALPPSDPNDPLLQRQWAMRLLNASRTWGITIGERFVDGPLADVVVGLIDSGPETSHPDLFENIDPNGWDFVLQQPYDELNAPIVFDSHGTNVASCIAATNNNVQGLASIPWEAVSILPCRVNDLVTVNNVTTSVFLSSAIVDAIYYCIQQQVDVINMSFAPASTFSAFSDPIMEQAIADAYAQGIVLVGASGDSRFFGNASGVRFPANLPEVISVGAVGPSGEVAYYSAGGPTLDVVAPGGNDPSSSDVTRRVLVADSSGGTGAPGIPAGYGYAEGTSLACGYVSGTIAMLITQGARDEELEPTEQVEAIRELLHETARKPLGQFSPDYGFGIVDSFAALRAITQYIDITAPEPGQTTESFSEPLEASIIQPIPEPLFDGDFQVFQNGVDITEAENEDGDYLVEIIDPDLGLIQYVPDVNTRYNIGINRLNIVADNLLIPGALRSLEGPAEGRIPERAFRFRVLPRTELPGLKMISIPYQLVPDADTLQFLFGGNLVRVARWLPERSTYALFDIVGSPQDEEADLLPPPARDVDLDDPFDQEEVFDEVGVRRPPAGLGFFARVNSPTQVQLLGKSVRTPFYEIKVKPGWNLIGNPYPFRVPWNVVNVRFGNEVMSIQEASNRNLIRNTIWRYQDGRYQFKALPNGELVEWEAHWVRSFHHLTLIIPRVAAILGQAAPTTYVASGNTDGWTSSFEATAGDTKLGQVFLGASKSAANTYGPEDVETPPAAVPGNDFRIAHRDWGKANGRYAQDIRSARDRTHQWTLEVETSKPGTPVKLTWDHVPGVKGFVRVEGQNKTYPLHAGKAEFIPERAGVRRVTVVTTSRTGA